MGTLEPAQRDRALALIASGIDGDRLLELAGRHGLGANLYRVVNEMDPPPLPGPLFRRLWVAFEFAAQRNRSAAAELMELLDLFEGNGIPALPFKGPTLATSLYGDVAFRQFGDLDVLVPTWCLTRARDLVEDRGYEPAYPLSSRRETVLLRDERHHALAHFHPGKDVALELHWRTDCAEFGIPGIDERWWERRPRVDFQGVEIRSFTPEEYVYLLGMHGTRHHWMSLSLIVDLAAMVRKHPDLDWQRVIAMAEAQGTLRIMVLGLALARQLLETPLPELVLSRIDTDPMVPVVTGQTIRLLGLTDAPPLIPREKLAYEYAWFRFWPPWLRRFLELSLLPNMADWSRWDLPPILSIAYYPLHLGRLIAQYGLRPDKKLFR